MHQLFSTSSLQDNPSRAVLKADSQEHKDKFSQSHCLVTISVGQEVHEGDKFLSTLSVVNKSFKKATLCVDDTLQRHSMALVHHTTAAEMLEAAENAGNEWLERNLALIEKLDIDWEIVRWNDWLYHQDFKDAYLRVEEKLKQDITYHELVVSSVNEFAERYARRVPKEDYDYNRVARVCLNYLKEECAAMLLWQNQGWHFEVYPGKRNAAMRATHCRFILPKSPDLLHAVWVKFRGRKQLKPQNFQSENVVDLEYANNA